MTTGKYQYGVPCAFMLGVVLVKWLALWALLSSTAPLFDLVLGFH